MADAATMTAAVAVVAGPCGKAKARTATVAIGAMAMAPVIVILRANTHAGRFYFVPAKKSKMPTSVPFYNVFLCPIATNYCQLYVD